MKSTLSVVVGGLYGSEAKGTIVGMLAMQTDAPVVVRVGGPNAGHTVYDSDFREWKLRQIPVGFINPNAELVIAAGSEINYGILTEEVQELEAAGHKILGRLWVDREATILTGEHIAHEEQMQLTDQFGSTAKGVGAARADRVWRMASRFGDIDSHGVDTMTVVNHALKEDRHVIIEGTQGYGLGLHAGEYPFCTSGDVRAIDFMSQVGISPWSNIVKRLSIWIVFRTRPIRVAGNSGCLKGETTWEQLHLPNEYTTVTKRVRRVGEWDPDLAQQALAANGHPSKYTCVAMMMLDQMFPEVREAEHVDQLSLPARRWLSQRETEMQHAIQLIGTGPNTQIVL
jgi:adenylosuccinate synthase